LSNEEIKKIKKKVRARGEASEKNTHPEPSHVKYKEETGLV